MIDGVSKWPHNSILQYMQFLSMWPEHNTLTCETKHRILKPDCGLRVIRDFYHFWVSSLGLTTTVVQLAHKFWTFEYLYVIKCNTHLNDCGLRIMFLSPTFINVYNPDAEYKYNRSNILLSTAFSEPTSNIYIFPARQKQTFYTDHPVYKCLHPLLPSWASVCTFCIQSL